jgi:hypothetical protein
MAPSRLLPPECSVENTPSSKRLRLESEVTTDNNDCDVLPSHPLGIRPEGNAYTDLSQSIRQKSGSFSLLPDELLMHFLEYLDAQALYAFSHSDDLWRSLFVQYVQRSVSYT